MAAKSKNPDLKSTGYELFILLLSLVSIVNLAIVVIGPRMGLNSALLDVVGIINIILTLFFIFDFLYRLLTSQAKGHYFFKNWGWTDLLACLPNFRIFRLFRIFKAGHLMRDFGPKNMLYEIVNNRADSALYLAMFGIILVAEVAGLGVLHAEIFSPEANITSANDVVWWVFVTLTTVGYGDYFPVTNAGRVWGIFVMFSGVALIGVLASYLASFFMETIPPAEEEEYAPTDPRSTLADLKTLLVAQQTAQEVLMNKVAELETLLAQSSAEPE